MVLYVLVFLFMLWCFIYHPMVLFTVVFLFVMVSELTVPMVNERQELVEKGRQLIGNSSGGIDQIPFIGGLIGKGLTYLVPGKSERSGV